MGCLKNCFTCGLYLQATIVAVFSLFIAINPYYRTVFVSFLVYLDFPLGDNPLALHVDQSGIYKNEDVKKRMLQIREVSSFEELAEDWDSPGIIRGISPNCMEIMQSMPSDVEINMYDTDPKDNGNMCRAGFDYTGDVELIKISDWISGTTPFTNKYAAFNTFLTDDQFNVVAPGFVKNMAAKIGRDTNFVSNFSESHISTAIHGANCVKSWSLQCTGEKRWLLFPLEVMPESFTLTTPAIIPAFMNETIFFREDMKVQEGIVRGGDLLYFPPSWMHLVQTRPGPNMMFNFREVDVKHSTRDLPMLTIMTLFLRLLDAPKAGLFEYYIRKFSQLLAPKVEEEVVKHNISLQYNPLDFRNPLDEHMTMAMRTNCPREESQLLKYLYDNMS